MKTYSEGRIEVLNFEKMLEKSSQFLSSAQPIEPKSLDVALNIARVALGKLAIAVNLEANCFEF